MLFVHTKILRKNYCGPFSQCRSQWGHRRMSSRQRSREAGQRPLEWDAVVSSEAHRTLAFPDGGKTHPRYVHLWKSKCLIVEMQVPPNMWLYQSVCFLVALSGTVRNCIQSEVDSVILTSLVGFEHWSGIIPHFDFLKQRSRFSASVLWLWVDIWRTSAGTGWVYHFRPSYSDLSLASERAWDWKRRGLDSRTDSSMNLWFWASWLVSDSTINDKNLKNNKPWNNKWSGNLFVLHKKGSEEGSLGYYSGSMINRDLNFSCLSVSLTQYGFCFGRRGEGVTSLYNMATKL